jgi:hypothetical protein
MIKNFLDDLWISDVDIEDPLSLRAPVRGATSLSLLAGLAASSAVLCILLSRLPPLFKAVSCSSD